MLTKEEADDYMQLIKYYANTPTDYCDLDYILQGDCNSCPYRLSTPYIGGGNGVHCVATSYDRWGLL